MELTCYHISNPAAGKTKFMDYQFREADYWNPGCDIEPNCARIFARTRHSPRTHRRAHVALSTMILAKTNGKLRVNEYFRFAFLYNLSKESGLKR